MPVTRKVLPVVLAGGSGTRLWPLSRESYPKQFLALMGEDSLFKQTLLRVAGDAFLPPLVISYEAHRFLIAEQLRTLGLPMSGLMLEPVQRGTAPAAALAAQFAQAHFDEPVLLLVLPADHFIPCVDVFQATIEAAMPLAEAGHLITFGVQPTHPEPGFGYIEPGAALGEKAFKAQAFIEKPPLAEATAFYEGGRHLWNSGVFLFKPDSFLGQLEIFAPDMVAALSPVWAHRVDTQDFIQFDKTAFAAVPEDSIDYAVMEKTAQTAVMPLATPWFDLGSWKALADVIPQDSDNNVLMGDVVTAGSQDCIIRSQARLVTAVGVKDLVIVETPDAVLVMDKHCSAELKQVVNQLSEQGRPEGQQHQTVHRPWGHFATMIAGERFQVKRITVAVGAQLSLQMHHHRSEHWVVVKGTARVSRGEEVFLLSENQSTYIPIGATHRLENVGKIPLEIIEVQSGSYLGEDDIVRLEDVYGRDRDALKSAVNKV